MVLPRKPLLALTLLSLCMLVPADAWAIFELSVSPRDGGQNVRFDVSPSEPGLLRNEEVTVAVTTDEGQPYRITQTSHQPLTNERGDVIPQGAFIVFSPSSPLGNLRVEQETAIYMGQTNLYTSNGSGESDSFLLVFNVRVPENLPGGVYQTRLTYMLEPTNAGTALSTRVVHLDVRVELRSTFKIDIRRSGGGTGLDLSRIDRNRPVAKGALSVRIDANLGSRYRITQELAEPLTSQTGFVISPNVFIFEGVGASRGELAVSGQARTVSESQEVVYTNQEGSGDAFELRYSVLPESAATSAGESAKPLRAGIYTGTLLFRVESSSSLAPTETFRVPVRLEIEPVLYLEVKADGGTGLSFGRFRPDDLRERTVTLDARSNLGVPYQVSQILSRRLVNEKGQPLPEEIFTYFADEPQGGKVGSTTPTPVREGEDVVYTSDAKGTTESVKLHYSLIIPKDTSAGSYNSDIKYSITTL